MDYFGTLRARLGWANNTILVFGTGGLAWGHVKTQYEVFNVVASAAAGPNVQAALQAGASASSNKIRVGYAVGGGLEWILVRNWTARGEYLFIDLRGGDTLTIPGGVAHSEFSMHVVRLVVNYRFGQ